MSSAAVTLSVPQSYFCYQCNRTVTLTPSPNADLSCPHCNGGFLEEYNAPTNPNPNPFGPVSVPELFSSLLFGSDPFTHGPGSGPVFVTSSSSTIDFGNPRNFSPFFTARGSNEFNPLTFLQSYLTSRGSNFQVVIENHPGPGQFDPSFGNIGDYFLGPGLEQLIQQLAENDPNRYGTPPASKRAIECLPDVVISDEIMKSDLNSCAVCISEFEIGSSSKQMPCKHLYHSECLIPWLELHNSCPVCRFELPTDDPDYENRRKAGGGGGGGVREAVESGGSGGGGEQSGGGDGGGVRMFSISFPWPFGSPGGNSGDRNNSSSSSGAQQRGGGGGGGGGSQPREESLD